VAARLYYAGLRAPNPSKYWKPLWERMTKRAYYVPVVVYDYSYFYNPKTVKGIAISQARGAQTFVTEWSPAR
jgi:hypothetical protein